MLSIRHWCTLSGFSSSLQASAAAQRRIPTSLPPREAPINPSSAALISAALHSCDTSAASASGSLAHLKFLSPRSSKQMRPGSASSSAPPRPSREATPTSTLANPASAARLAAPPADPPRRFNSAMLTRQSSWLGVMAAPAAAPPFFLTSIKSCASVAGGASSGSAGSTRSRPPAPGSPASQFTRCCRR